MTYLFCLINLFKNSDTIEMILLMCYSVQTLYKYISCKTFNLFKNFKCLQFHVISKKYLNNSFLHKIQNSENIKFEYY